MNPSPDPELELLRSGLESYLPAMNAIVAFRRRIQAVCRTVMEKHVGSYSKALRTTLSALDIQNWTGPTLNSWDGKWTSIGVLFKNVGSAALELYLATGWTREGPGEFTTGVSVYVPTKTTARAANDLFHPHPEGWWEEEKSFGFSTWHTPDAAPQLEEHLTAVLEQWIELWRNVGGLKALNGK